MITEVKRAAVTKIEFKEALLVYKTDRVEIDIQRSKACVVNSAGKIKQSVSFRVFGVPTDGAETATGD